MTDTAPVKPNDIIAGKYRVDRVLGAGGMGIVVAATHLELGQPVALKFLLDELAHRDELVARFLREARNCVSISSEHVVRVMDVGRLDSGAPYMVMEYLQGHDLESELARYRTLPVQRAADITLQTCMGLAEAHRRNLVHRDLKPANLFLTTRSDGASVVKILDFGISKSLDAASTDGALTRTNQSMGTPYYMSPEQVRAAPGIDFRTDIWSLGAILYEMLAGSPPFRAESASAVCAQVLEASPQPMDDLRPDVNPDVWEIITWCLRKKREDRPQNVAQLARALQPHASPEGSMLADRVSRVLGINTEDALVPAKISTAPTEPGMTDTSFSRTGSGQSKNGHSTLAILAVGAAGILASGLAASLYFADDEALPPALSSTTQNVSPASAPPAPSIPPQDETAENVDETQPPGEGSASAVPSEAATSPSASATASANASSVAPESPVVRIARPRKSKKVVRVRPSPTPVIEPPVRPRPRQPAIDPLDGR